MNNKNLNKLITEALAMEAQDVKEAGRVGFMARAMVQATMPHSKVTGNEFTRHNGLFTLSILAPKKIGLPYGAIPRLLMAWLTTEAVRTKERHLVLGHSLSEFMRELGICPTGGRWGTIGRLREQMKRLLSASISCTYDDGKRWAMQEVRPVTQANLWWNPTSPEQGALFASTLTLGEEFFKEAIANPVPIDMRTLKALSKSPLALDIYCWLTYRMSYLRKPTLIPWVSLRSQFGAGYALNAHGGRDFKRAFLRELKKVLLCYPSNAEEAQEGCGLLLKPGRPHIKRLAANPY